MRAGIKVAIGLGVAAAGAAGHVVHSTAKEDMESGGTGAGAMALGPLMAAGTTIALAKVGGQPGAIVGMGAFIGALGGVAAAAMTSSRLEDEAWSRFGPIKEGAVLGQLEWGTGTIDVVVTGVHDGQNSVRVSSDYREWFPGTAKDHYIGSVADAETRKEYPVTVEFRHRDGSTVDVSERGPISVDRRDHDLPPLGPVSQVEWTDTPGDGIAVVQLPKLNSVLRGAPSDGPRGMPMSGDGYRGENSTFPERWEASRRERASSDGD